MEFIGREIRVEWVQEPGWKRPVALLWDGRTLRVSTVIARWDDYGFGLAAPRRKKWYHRRHRTWYEVETEGGDRFRLYMDRGGRGSWVLVGRVGGPAPAGRGSPADAEPR